MKLLISIFELILMIAPIAYPQNKLVVSCTVTGSTSVVCELPDHIRGVRSRFEGIDWDHPAFAEWLLQPQYHTNEKGERIMDYNAPFIKVRPKVGDKFKAAFARDGDLIALASCDVRALRKFQENAKAHEGERVSLILEYDEDC